MSPFGPNTSKRKTELSINHSPGSFQASVQVVVVVVATSLAGVSHNVANLQLNCNE